MVIIRTFHLIWKVIQEEASLTNRHIEKVELGVLKARIETAKTIILLDKATYESQNVQRLLDDLTLRVKETTDNVDVRLADVKNGNQKMLDQIGED